MSDQREEPATTIVIFGDFNCPFSALANSRASRLADAGEVSVEWRCVEHDPSIGPRETPLTDRQRAGFESELAQIRALLTASEHDRLRVPSRRLNTRDLNLIYAATPPAERHALRTALFDAIWSDDLDLTDDAVIDAITDSLASLTSPDPDGRHLETAATAARTVATWQGQWRDHPRPIVPSMVMPHGTVSRGLGALARLAVVPSPCPPRDEPAADDDPCHRARTIREE
ncbi:MAG: DsbA family protein [Ilumatobacteraceae bacterium]